MAYIVTEKLCITCEACERECPTSAITMTGNGGSALVKPDLCIECGACYNVCPTDAVNPE